MKRVVLMVIIIIELFSVKVKAIDNCETNELTRLRELAKKVEFDYEYKLVDNKAIFSINAVNLNSELKVLIIENYYNQVYKEFKNNGLNVGTLSNFNSGERVVVTIKAYVPNWCSGKTLLTKTVKIPYYNYYYSEAKCRGNEDFKYCKQLIDSNITEKTFNSQLEAYLKQKEEKKEEKKEERDNTVIYIIIGIISIILAIGSTILVINNIKKRNSL